MDYSPGGGDLSARPSRFNRKSAAAFTSLATLAALVMPLIGVSQATHVGPHSSRELRITPEVDLNQVGTEHTLTAQIDLPADANGVDVDFEIVCHTSDFGPPGENTNTGPNNNAVTGSSSLSTLRRS